MLDVQPKTYAHWFFILFLHIYIMMGIKDKSCICVPTVVCISVRKVSLSSSNIGDAFALNLS